MLQSPQRLLLSQDFAEHKLPERLEIVPALPLSNVGKISTKDLRADVENMTEKENAPT
ncbi:hypothetical protein ACFRIB_32675 [Streptomyces mirabilis]|uniref:hypothetical protein n=1 Tax=Streptomyces mirabilis TaxID=68239 RepID=UPI0036A021FC